VAGAKLRELQILVRFSPASIFLVLFTPFGKRGQSVSLMDIVGGKIAVNLKKLH
jgi:hypothetical protein